MKFPPQAAFAKDKLSFCYEAQERLRLAFNLVGTWFREGSIDDADFLILPKTWQTFFDAREKKIDKTVFEEFKNTVYHDAEAEILMALGETKKQVMNDLASVNAIDLDAVLERKKKQEEE